MFSLQSEWERYDSWYGRNVAPRLVNGSGGPQIVTDEPGTGGSGSEGSSDNDQPAAGSTVYRQVIKDADGDGDTEEVWVAAVEYTLTTNSETGTKKIVILWADGIREESVITRDGRETCTSSLPDGTRVVETRAPNGAPSYVQYDAEGNAQVISNTDSEGFETTTEYGDGYVREMISQGSSTTLAGKRNRANPIDFSR
ncbi:hypothetical protein [Microvirga sp. BSC39]|uniref:hypothetical protein n=1 Tax=Microvirga sp. BSC39 TaxID=1549810 RepID=UPI00126A3663|nr:hypothetical protein [Microvirga sp. BSC39]